MSRFEDVADLSEATITKILMSDALRQKILAQKGVEEQILLVKEALIEEDKKVRQALSNASEEVGRLRKTDEDKASEIINLRDQIERETVQKRELEQKIKDTQSKLINEQEAKQTLETRVNRLENAEKVRYERTAVTRFLAIWCLLAPIVVAALGWATERIFGSWRIDTFAVCVSIFVWMSLTSWNGKRSPVVMDDKGFKVFLSARKWLFSLLGTLILGAGGNALWELWKK